MTVKEKLKCILVRAASDDYSLATRIEVEKDYIIKRKLMLFLHGIRIKEV